MSQETERTVVKTYVPAYQKETWSEHADSLDMSQSEFVRTMVQAGRRSFQEHEAEATHDDATPGVDGLETRLLDVLEEDSYRTFDEIADEVIEDLERDVEEALLSLDDADRIEHSPRRGYARAPER